MNSSPFLAQVEAGLARLAHLPTLVAWGVATSPSDPRIGVASSPPYPTTPPASRGAGHLVQEEAPDEIVQAIEDRWPENEDP